MCNRLRVDTHQATVNARSSKLWQKSSNPLYISVKNISLVFQHYLIFVISENLISVAQFFLVSLKEGALRPAEVCSASRNQKQPMRSNFSRLVPLCIASLQCANQTMRRSFSQVANASPATVTERFRLAIERSKLLINYQMGENAAVCISAKTDLIKTCTFQINSCKHGTIETGLQPLTRYVNIVCHRFERTQ